MSKNICPCCKGTTEYLDYTQEYSSFLCVGCEIKIYSQLHNIIAMKNIDKEKAYQYLVDNQLLKLKI